MPSRARDGVVATPGGVRRIQTTARLAGSPVYDTSGAPHATQYGGTGAPAPTLGKNGDIYFRDDTPGTANQRIYVKSAGSWTGVV